MNFYKLHTLTVFLGGGRQKSENISKYRIGCTGMLSIEEKERILKMLEVDREFRYALMGLLGYKEVLERITALEERVIELDERVLRVEEKLGNLGRVMNVIAHRFGILTGEGFREAIEVCY
uniref:DUF3782 domain-containing protein n=1 Tax=Ignisphaera aggregans TaxID=334771 RepID=A0A7J3I789_9CREN